MDEISMTLGFLVGRQIAGQRRAKPAERPEPSFQPPMGSGEYLFNGVRLPAFPEYDQQEYRYAMITDQPFFGVPYRILRVFSIVDDSDGTVTYSNSMHCNSYNGGSWSEWTEFEGATEKMEIIWSNFDIHNADGTVKLYAIEPIPVYE